MEFFNNILAPLEIPLNFTRRFETEVGVTAAASGAGAEQADASDKRHDHRPGVIPLIETHKTFAHESSFCYLATYLKNTTVSNRIIKKSRFKTRFFNSL